VVGLFSGRVTIRSHTGAASGNSRLVVFNSDGLAGLRGYCAQAEDEPSVKQQLTLSQE